MANYIILGRDGRPSIRGVFSLMKSDCIIMVRRRFKGKEYWRRYTNHNSTRYEKINTFSPSAGDKVIRWGTRIEFPQTGFTSVNSPRALGRATNKLLARQVFAEHNVPAPRLITPSNFDEVNPTLVVARPHQHSKGKNFVTLKTKAEFVEHYNIYNAGWYYSQFIDKTSEYRVHCAFGKVIAVLKKPKPEDTEVIAWNRSINHEAFTHVAIEEVKKSVLLVALQATSALGLDISAVDVIWRNPNAYVLEVNTAPTLNSSPLTTEKYAKVFDWVFNFGNKTWDYTTFEKGSSLLWKNFQLENNI